MHDDDKVRLKMRTIKLELCESVLRQIAEMPRRTREQRLANAAIEFVDSQPTEMESILFFKKARMRNR